MRSHPPTLITLARRTIVKEALFARGARVLVAVSGGPDSTALLHVLAKLRPKLGFTLVAHGVDHGVRDDAARELDLAASLAKDLDVPFTRTTTKIAAGGNLQARARTRRFEALRAAAKQHDAVCIATAHHGDDRAETVLLRLLRGASPAGLAVLPPKSRELVRPLLRARRRDIDAHIARHALPFSVDPSNLDPRFLRVRVRTELLPLLESLSPGIVAHLNGLADDLLAGRSEEAFLPPLSRAARVAIAALAKGGPGAGKVQLPGGLVVAFERPTF